MKELLDDVFWKNAEIHKRIYEFCENIPEYRQSKEQYEMLAEEIDRTMGRAFYLDFEQALNAYIAQEVHAYYLFGLGLRQEILSALT